MFRYTIKRARKAPVFLGLVNKNAAANRAEGLQIAFFQMRGRGSLLKRK